LFDLTCPIVIVIFKYFYIIVTFLSKYE
jgi:hypothetical protein